MAIIIKDKEINDVSSIIGVEWGEEIRVPVEFSGCVFNEEIDLVNKRFERWLSFKQCVFKKTVLFGRIDSHLHSSHLEQDLVFQECEFEEKACFDGITCNGSVTFDHCFFRYKSVNKQDFALSLQAVTIMIQLAITDCDFIGGGLSLNSAKIERVGCHINCDRILSERGIVDFRGAHLGDEFDIQGSEIICSGVLFELVSVNPKGHVKIAGKTIFPNMPIEQTVFRVFNRWALDNSFCFTANEEESIRDYLLLYYFYDGKIEYAIKDDKYFYSVNVTEKSEIENVVKSFISNDTEFLRLHCINNNVLEKEKIDRLKTMALIPLVERWQLNDGTKTKGFLCVSRGEVYYKKETEFDYVLIGDLFNGLEPFFFPDEYSRQIERKTFGDFDCYLKGNTNHVYKLSCFVYGYTGELHTFVSLTIPTVIQSSELITFNSMICGCRLHLADSIFFTPELDFDRLIVTNDIIIEVSNIRTINFNFIDVKSDSIRFEMVSIYYGGDKTFGISQSNTGWSSVGMRLEGTEVRKMQFKHLHVDSSLKVNNIVFSLRDSRINDQFIIDNIYCHKSPTNGCPNIMVDLRDSKIGCFRNFNLLTQEKMCYLITGMEVEEIRMEYSMFDEKGNYLPDKSDMIFKLINDKIFIGNAVPLLRTIEKLYDENDKHDIANDIWKYRNNLRIKQHYSQKKAKWLIRWNKYFTNYGLSAKYLVGWLLLFMIVFDAIVSLCFHINVGVAIANGFMEFMPINFNDPVVDGVRGENLSFKCIGYSVAVIIYRFFSYILLSVIIASMTGYFNKKNK